MASCSWSAEQLARAMDGRGSGDAWSARCPAHDDSNPSLSIWTDSDGKTAWACMAGCDWKAVTAVLEQRFPDAFDRPAARRAKPGRIVETYDYRDAAGELLGQVVRFEPKDFRQRRPDGKGGWTWKLEGLQLPLYRLPEIAPCKAVFVVEGEKDARALETIGLPATCNPGGAGKWRELHSLALAGKRVCIIADKDRAGRAHAQKIAEALAGIAESVRVIEAPDPHKDAADWIAGGAVRETITAKAKAAPEWRPLQASSAPDHDNSGDAPDLDVAGHDGHSNWRAGLLINDRDGIRPILANAMHALRYAPSIGTAVRWDTFRMRLIASRDLPWGTKAGALWSDQDDAHLAEWLQHNEIRVGTDIAHSAADAVGHQAAFDSLRDYLRGLRWDGKPRLANLARHFGNTSLLGSDVMLRFAVSAVARALQPGCQADHVIVLEGEQRQRKSTALRVLFDPLEAGWFRDDLEDLHGKQAKEELQGAWCIEIAELQAVNARRAELEHVKAYVTRRVDSFRPAYGRRVLDVPRRNVFAGTTNERTYLRDHTGNRRWWPVPCERIDVDRLLAERDQLWAQAVAEFDCGTEWWFPVEPEDLSAMQEERTAVDPWIYPVSDYLFGHDTTTLDDIFTSALKIEPGKRGQMDSNRISRVLQTLGWQRHQFRDGGRRYWGYVSREAATRIAEQEDSNPLGDRLV